MLGSDRQEKKTKEGQEMRALLLASVVLLGGCAGMDYNRYIANSNYLQLQSNSRQLQQMRTQQRWNDYQMQRAERMRRFGMEF